LLCRRLEGIAWPDGRPWRSSICLFIPPPRSDWFCQEFRRAAWSSCAHWGRRDGGIFSNHLESDAVGQFEPTFGGVMSSTAAQLIRADPRLERGLVLLCRFSS